MSKNRQDEDTRRYWLWVTKPEYYDQLEGVEYGKCLDAAGEGGWWTCHRDTKRGDLVLLYRTTPMRDIAFLMQAQTDAYSLVDDSEASKNGWQYGCDYHLLYRFGFDLALSLWWASKQNGIVLAEYHGLDDIPESFAGQMTSLRNMLSFLVAEQVITSGQHTSAMNELTQTGGLSKDPDMTCAGISSESVIVTDLQSLELMLDLDILEPLMRSLKPRIALSLLSHNQMQQLADPITIEEIKEDRILSEWGAFRAMFRRMVFGIPSPCWYRLCELAAQKNRGFRTFIEHATKQKIALVIQREEELERRLADDLSVLKGFGFDLQLYRDPKTGQLGQQYRTGIGGIIDLLCVDRRRKCFVVVDTARRAAVCRSIRFGDRHCLFLTYSRRPRD